MPVTASFASAFGSDIEFIRGTIRVGYYLPFGPKPLTPGVVEDQPPGTSLQRWHRELLRKAMEAEGFAIYAPEWWHFDYKDWQRYRIGNELFETIGTRRP